MKRVSLVLIILALSASWLFVACSDSDPGEPGGATPSPEATATAGTPEPLPESLQRILDRVSEVRELEAPPSLNVEFVPRSGVVDLIDELTTDKDREWFAKVTDLYRLLGHLRNDQDYLDVYRSFGGEAVLGLYSPIHDTLWIVHEDGREPDLDNLSRPLEETLVHEIVHALQDYHFDLVATDDPFEDNFDITQAWTAVIEGDAVTHEGLYSARFLSLPGSPVILASAAQIPNVPPSIIREMYFPYTTGADWVRAERDKRGTSRIDAWLADPPPGTAYILHPELLDSGFEPDIPELPDLSKALGKGFERTWSSTLGEFNLRNYLQLYARASSSASAAEGWAGDRFDIYKDGEASVGVFRVRFTDEGEAAEFDSAYREFLDRAHMAMEERDGVTFAELRDGDVVALAGQQGTDVIFAIASNRELVSQAISALRGGWP